MSDPLIRELDHYVVLEPGKPEQLLPVAETLAWLEQQLSSLESIPEDLSGLADDPRLESLWLWRDRLGLQLGRP